MKRVCIHQPDFAPYLGFFYRLLLVDLFIAYDDAQFVKGGWHHRDKIKTLKGVSWLTLPVHRGPLGRPISEVSLTQNHKEWKRFLNLLKENYGNTKYFDVYFPKLAEICEGRYERMLDLNMALLEYFYEIFEIRVQSIMSSSLNVKGSNNERLVKMIKAVDGTHYLSGTGARAYLDERLFEKSGLVVEWQEYSPPVYPQLFGDFVPDLSCIDVVFNCGPRSAEILRSCLKEKSV